VTETPSFTNLSSMDLAPVSAQVALTTIQKILNLTRGVQAPTENLVLESEKSQDSSQANISAESTVNPQLQLEGEKAEEDRGTNHNIKDDEKKRNRSSWKKTKRKKY